MQSSGLRTLTIADEWNSELALNSDAWVWWAGEVGADRSLIAFANESLEDSRNAVLSSWHGLCCSLSSHLKQDRIIKFWMNPLTEMSPYKSDLLAELVKVAALRRLLGSGEYRQVKYVGKNKAIVRLISSLCDEIELDFVRVSRNSRSGRRTRIRFFRTLGLTYLAYHVATRWSLRSRTRSTSGDVLIISYFAHLDWELLDKGIFRSFQWSGLRDSVLSSTSVDWLHHYISTTGVVSAGSARKFVDKLDADIDQHTFLDSTLNFQVVAHATVKLLKNSFSRHRTKKLRSTMSRNGLLAEWHAVQLHCRDGLYGVAYCKNLITDILVKRFVANRSKSAPALLLWENQPWERAFCHHWHRNTSGQILAYSHTTVPFWCLSYFDGFLGRVDEHEFASVSPDRHLINGRLSLDALLEADQSADRFTEVEAFRYLDLSQVENRKQIPDSTAPLILVLGEIRQDQSLKLLSVLVSALRRSNGEFRFVFKPHPAGGLNVPTDLLQLMHVDSRPVVELLRICDAVVGCAGTSAVVEAAAVGIPCASFAREGELNLSSLLGLDNHCFVRNEEEMGQFLSTVTSSETRESQDLFCLDAELPRWTSVLKTVGVELDV